MTLDSSSYAGRVVGTVPVAVGLGFAFVSLFVWMKGFNTDVQVWGKFHWLITYEDGFIRRGLTGSLFQYFFGHAPWSVQAKYIVYINAVCSFGIVAALGLWLAARLSARKEAAHTIELTTAAALFTTSQFLPTVAYNTGYLDSIIYLILLSAVMLVGQGYYLACALLGAVAPFIHETFIVLWPPVALFALRANGALRSRLICALAPVLGTLPVVFLVNESATLAQVMALPVPDADKQNLLQWQLGQSISSAFKNMVSLHIRNWPRQLWAFLFYCTPALLMTVTYTFLRLGQFDLTKGLFLPACFLSPLVALAFGWDLSRFLVVANLTTFAGILLIDGTFGRVERRPSLLLVIAWPMIALGFFSPLVYAYFDSARDVTRSFHAVRGTVLYRAVASLSEVMTNAPRPVRRNPQR